MWTPDKKVGDDEKKQLYREASRILSIIEDMYYYGNGGNCEWIVTNIGPLLPKEGE